MTVFAPKHAVPQPSGTSYFESGETALLVVSFETDGEVEDCASSLKVVFSVLDDSIVAESAIGGIVSVADSLHLADEGSQYAVSMDGPAAIIGAVHRRFLRSPGHPSRSRIRFTCLPTPLGNVWKRRLRFAGDDKDLPLMTLATAPNLAGLLAQRLSPGWPQRHDGPGCLARLPD